MSTNTIYANLQCEFCGKILANNKTLKNHVARHIEAKESNFTCKFCTREFKNKMGLSQHERLCKENENASIKIYNHGIRKNNKNNDCRFCGINCRKKELPKHEIWCKENPNLEYVKEFYASGKKNPNQYIKAKMLGLPKPEMTEEQRQKISRAGSNQVWSDERRKKQSESMRNAVINHPESYSVSFGTRSKKIKKYDIRFDSTWELIFYEWCLKHNIEVIDNLNFFPYMHNGKEHLYNPDFYLPEHNIYVEVKGYTTDVDISKWKCFTEKLYVLKAAEIDAINKDEFTLEEIIKGSS